MLMSFAGVIFLTIVVSIPIYIVGYILYGQNSA